LFIVNCYSYPWGFFSSNLWDTKSSNLSFTRHWLFCILSVWHWQYLYVRISTHLLPHCCKENRSFNFSFPNISAVVKPSKGTFIIALFVNLLRQCVDILTYKYCQCHTDRIQNNQCRVNDKFECKLRKKLSNWLIYTKMYWCFVRIYCIPWLSLSLRVFCQCSRTIFQGCQYVASVLTVATILTTLEYSTTVLTKH
jgi:hypothetical protein